MRFEREIRFRLCWKAPPVLKDLAAISARFSKSLATTQRALTDRLSKLSSPPLRLGLPRTNLLIRDAWILYESSSDREREEAAKRLAKRISTNFANPTVRSAFDAWKKQLGDQDRHAQLYEWIIPTCFHLISSEFEKPQSRIRFGKTGPTLKNVKPSQLTPGRCSQWLVQSAPRSF